MKNAAWTEEELDFLRNNYIIMTNAEMAKALDRTKAAIDLKLNRLGIHKSKYHYDHNYFSVIDTIEKAYWLGFISADGYVQYKHEKESRNYELGIELQYSDRNHLKLFNKCLQGNIEVGERTRISYFDKNKLQQVSFIRIYSKKMVTDLMKLGVMPNKSCMIEFNNILNSDLMSHYIRGYFDGNGCISVDSKIKKRFSIDFTSGSKDFLSGLREHLYQNNINSYLLQEKENTYRLFIKGISNCDVFLNYIYKDSDSVRLDRKYRKACDLYQKFNYARRLPLHSEMGGFLN